MGSIALSSPFQSLTDSLVVPNQSLSALGAPLVPYKYTGTGFSLALAALGAPTVPPFPAVPADAVAVEVWSSSDAAGDGVAFAVRSGQLSNTGVLATNTSNNIGTTGSVPSQYALIGTHMVIPLPSVGGAIPAGWRFAALNTASITLQGRYVSQAAGYPYLLTATEEFLLVGAGAVAQVPFATAAKFPAGYVGAQFRVIGAGVRCSINGPTPAAAVGDILAPGMYYVDQARHGISLSALQFFLPSGTFIVGNSLMATA